jgi:EAL domain-containing protein (putative c-di-GMP-specific phosphodiesterase class I)
MLRALVELSRDLGLQVIAEGVETQEQADLLTEIGCPLVQGYLFGLPASAQECGLPAPRVSGARAGAADDA